MYFKSFPKLSYKFMIHIQISPALENMIPEIN
jgi:hypothetical protein